MQRWVLGLTHGIRNHPYSLCTFNDLEPLVMMMFHQQVVNLLRPSIAYGNSITNIRRSVFNWWIQQTSREKPRTAETVTVARYDTSVQKMLEAPPNSNKATHLHLITCSWLPLTPCDVKTIGSQKPSPPAPPQKNEFWSWHSNALYNIILRAFEHFYTTNINSTSLCSI